MEGYLLLGPVKARPIGWRSSHVEALSFPLVSTLVQYARAGGPCNGLGSGSVAAGSLLRSRQISSNIPKQHLL